MRNIRILTVKFRNQLQLDEIKWFRGAVIHALDKDNILFHNHNHEKYRYAYPLIQYKRINHCAAILCMEEGVEAIGDFFSNYTSLMRIGNREILLEMDYLRPTIFTIQVTEQALRYRLRRWLPLNRENYQTYRIQEGDEQRTLFLQNILVGNLLSCLKGLNIYIDKIISCRILEITRIYTIPNKGINLLAFDISFSVNLALPPYIGLGKNASINCGVLTWYPNE